MNPSLRAASVAFLTLGCASVEARSDLQTYLRAPDPNYRWEKRSVSSLPGGKVYDLHLVSQLWQGILWQHRLQYVVPDKCDNPHTAAMLITGGSGSDSDTRLALSTAVAAGSPMAVLYNIPNQPLFNGLNEDALIAYTFGKYLETGDSTWPLLFPMTKSAIRAMDALQAFAVQEGLPAIDRFVVAGASKRGWTTWLTAASGDKRVAGIIPMVYDNLNLGKQMPHQLDTWGRYSEQIEDYTRLGLQAQMATPRGQELGKMVDPHTYRSQIRVPKLIVNGSNDPYWTLDSLNIYWDDLAGPKWVYYAPNSGHGLEKGLFTVQGNAVAFIRSIASGKEPPAVSWSHSNSAAGSRLEMRGTAATTTCRLWTASSSTKDFRKAVWTSAPITSANGLFTAELSFAASGYRAYFGEATTDVAGRKFVTSTQVKILGTK